MTRRVFYFLGFLGVWMGFTVSGFSQAGGSTGDSTFWFLSLPELQNYKAYYMQELEALQEEKQNLIRRGIKDGEHLLQTKPDTKVVDEILIRLADLYYYDEKDDYLARMELYDKRLIQYEQGEIGDPPEEPRLDCRRSLEIYQRVIDEFPQSELVDDAIYNKGFLFEEMGQNEKANQIYLHLIDAYPRSKYVPEAYMRMGEYYFNPPVSDLFKAIHFYKKVLQYRNSLRYDEAQYKLGWSYYRLSQYPEAISYFTTLIENLRAVERYDPRGLAARADFRDEAVEYIAISFMDFGGPSKALEYLRKIEDPEWGGDVLEKLGDVYMQEKEEYRSAVAAYEALLDFSPSSPAAPTIQRKIVECYRAQNEETQALDARQKLFATYSSDGEWWSKTEDEKAKLRAYRLTEQALRENINGVIKRAEELSSESLYQKAVELGRTYLKSFPEDLYAYMIRWNIALILDTKLRLFKEALQEYLTISMVYNGSEYEKFAREKGLASVRDATENAIVVADSLVQMERRRTEGTLSVQTEVEKKKPMPLTTAESWLAMAYNNYIKRFPFDKNTPTILASAGALYYTHNQFNEALKYFKTLVKYFPRSMQIHNVRYSILESYFGKQDFGSTEIFAKKIIGSDAMEEIKKKAEKRLGESIFLKAQALADAGKTSRAADEFYRMALEVPSLEFADRALFNAGREYERIQEYSSAIRVYELLRVSYSGSPFLLDALNNLAFDYGEVGEYQKGAERYEALANLLKEGERKRDVLYNAFIFYGRAENWRKAIEIGKVYALRYPDAKDASAVYFKTGEYYLELNETEGAREIYSDFADRFPDSPLGVETYFRLGTHYLERDLPDEAEQAFQQAFSKSVMLKSRGLEENSYYAAEGLYFASRLLHDRFQKISFTLSQEALDEAVSQKQSLLQRLVDQYTKVISCKTHRLPESVYRIGEVYEDFAQTWANQEIPPLDPTSRAVREKEINGRTTQIYGQALTAYRKAVGVLERVMRETAIGEEEGTSSSSSSSDSLVSLTKVWLERAQEKTSETLYRMAEVNTQSIDQLLGVPIPEGLGDVARLEYRSQVLMKAIKPLLDLVVEAHRRNLHVADSLALKNRWTEASRSKILSSLSLLAKKYEELSFEALSGYRRTERLYRQTTIVQEKEASEDLVNSMVNLIDLSKSFAQLGLVFTKEGVKGATESGVTASEVTQIQDEMVLFVLQIADSLEKLIARGLVDQRKADDLFQTTGDLLYEESLAVFEDNVFFLSENLRMILGEAYRTDKEFKVPSPLGGWLRVRLVRMDPETYAEKLNIPVEEMIVRSDTTWQYTTTFKSGWERLDFDMTGWRYSRGWVGSEISQGGSRDLKIYGVSPTAGESSFYVRKEIQVPGFPVSGKMYFRTDLSNRFFVNGVALAEKMGEKPLSLTSYLREGKNLLAVEFKGTEMFSMGGAALIRYIPEEALPKTDRVK